MTVRELKEQINKDPNKLNKREKEIIKTNVLNLFDENTKVEQIIQNKFIFVSMLKSLYRKYDNTLDKESRKFIDFVIKRYPNIMLDYKIIDENTSEIKWQYISKNKLKGSSIQYKKGDISLLCYNAYINQILHYIRVETEEEEKNEQSEKLFADFIASLR